MLGDGALLTVIMSVLDGGEGCISGGRSERSMDSGDLLRDEARERCGEGIVSDMLCMCDCVAVCVCILAGSAGRRFVVGVVEGEEDR